MTARTDDLRRLCRHIDPVEGLRRLCDAIVCVELKAESPWRVWWGNAQLVGSVIGVLAALVTVIEGWRW
jgi:hypothetical protein